MARCSEEAFAGQKIELSAFALILMVPQHLVEKHSEERHLVDIVRDSSTNELSSKCVTKLSVGQMSVG